jgi:hypothetical protein
MFDVNFKEDGCRAKKDGPPKNLNILREAALKPLRAVGGGKRASVKRKTLRAGLVPDFLRKVLFGEQVLLLWIMAKCRLPQRYLNSLRSMRPCLLVCCL